MKHNKARGNHITLLQIDTLRCQLNELEHIGGPVALSIVEFCMAESIS